MLKSACLFQSASGKTRGNGGVIFLNFYKRPEAKMKFKILLGIRNIFPLTHNSDLRFLLLLLLLKCFFVFLHEFSEFSLRWHPARENQCKTKVAQVAELNMSCSVIRELVIISIDCTPHPTSHLCLVSLHNHTSVLHHPTPPPHVILSISGMFPQCYQKRRGCTLYRAID